MWMTEFKNEIEYRNYTKDFHLKVPIYKYQILSSNLKNSMTHMVHAIFHVGFEVLLLQAEPLFWIGYSPYVIYYYYYTEPVVDQVWYRLYHIVSCEMILVK